MADLKELMTDYKKEGTERMWGKALVYCPEYCESEYEIASVHAGMFIGQANQEDITQFVEKYVEIEDYL